MEPAKLPPPPTDRDPLGTRHKLSNLVMIVTGLEEEAKDDPAMQVRLLSLRITGMGFLAVTDVLGSVLTELRQWRDWSTRRPAKKASE